MLTVTFGPQKVIPLCSQCHTQRDHFVSFYADHGKSEKIQQGKTGNRKHLSKQTLFTWMQEIIYKGSLLVVLISEEQEVTVLFPFVRMARKNLSSQPSLAQRKMTMDQTEIQGDSL